MVTGRVKATLRWMGNSIATNAVLVNQSVAVILSVHQDDIVSAGTVVSAEVNPLVIPELVAASQETFRSAPEAGDVASLLAGVGAPDDWDACGVWNRS